MLLLVSTWMVLIICSATSVQSHSPYLTQETRVTFNGKTMTLALYNGDGVITTDPQRAVLYDKDGIQWAASPYGIQLFVHCRSEGIRSCSVFAPLDRSVFEMTAHNLDSGQKIVSQGKPLFYPSNLTEIGFTKRQLSLGETIRFEAIRVFRFPMGTIIAAIWWALVWLPLLIGLRVWRTRPYIKENAAATLVLLLSVLVPSGLLIYISFLVFFVNPYSQTYFIFICLTGLGLPHILTASYRKLRSCVSNLSD